MASLDSRLDLLERSGSGGFDPIHIVICYRDVAYQAIDDAPSTAVMAVVNDAIKLAGLRTPVVWWPGDDVATVLKRVMRESFIVNGREPTTGTNDAQELLDDSRDRHG